MEFHGEGKQAAEKKRFIEAEGKIQIQSDYLGEVQMQAVKS